MDFINEIVLQLNEGWFSFNKKSALIRINPKWEFLPEQTITSPVTVKSLLKALHVKQIEHFTERLNQCMTDSPVTNYFLKAKHRSYIVNARAVKGNENHVIGTIINGSDIDSTLKQLIKEKETAEYNDHLKSAFLANMAHDIRVPLTSISGFAEMMIEDDFTDDDKRGFARIIERNTSNLVHIVNDIIDVSKIEAGQIELVKSVFNPEQLFLDRFTKYQSELERLGKTEVTIKISLPEIKDNIWILTDKLRLKQILDHLLQNAIRYTHSGEICFGYTIENKFISIFVKDTGIGIPVEKQADLFRLSLQDEANYSKPLGRHGLGLHIVKNLADLMGSGLTFISEVHRGTSFTFSIPVHEKMRAVTKKTKTSKIKKPSSPWMNKKVLIVDDVREIFEYIRLSLRNSNVTCMYANSGEAAIKILETISDIDLILMDIQMPEQNGVDTLHAIKKMNLSIPVIALTGFALTGDKEKFIEDGFNEYIAKPIRQTDLFRTLKAFL